MRVTFINVGYGEAILIELNNQEGTGNPYTIMVDGGSNNAFEFKGFPQRIRASDYLKKKGFKRIDLLINTHIHEDHTCGLWDIINQVEVGELWCNYEIPAGYRGVFITAEPDAAESQSMFVSAVNSYNEIYFALKRKGIPIRQIYGVKQGILLQGGLSVDILGPSEEDYKLLQDKMNHMYSLPEGGKKSEAVAELDAWMNMVSIMLRFYYNGVKLFLPSDVKSNGYGHLKNPKNLLEADIFKAAHHGQIDGISDELAGFISPEIVITCASSDHRYNSSNEKTYEIIEKNAHKSGKRPIFLFSDNVEVKNFSENIVAHNAVVIEIDDKTSRINSKYI